MGKITLFWHQDLARLIVRVTADNGTYHEEYVDDLLSENEKPHAAVKLQELFDKFNLTESEKAQALSVTTAWALDAKPIKIVGTLTKFEKGKLQLDGCTIEVSEPE